MCVAKKTSKEDNIQQPMYEEIAEFHKEVLVSENAAYGHKEILVSENAAYGNVAHTAKNYQSNF